MFLLFAILLMFPLWSAADETEIFRCAQEDGSVAFQEMPCPDPAETEAEPDDEPVENDDGFFDFVNPFDNPETPVAIPEAAPSGPVSEDRGACEKAARDAIDAIDLEMRSTSYTREEGRAYLAELRVLTGQLRACKQL